MSSTATTSDNSQQSQSNLWRHPSIMSSHSNLTSSSGNESYLSLDSLEKDNTQMVDQFSFINHKSDNYYQLIDDLAIIDEIYQTFDDESESEPYERQVADAARNVAQKKHAVEQMCQSEELYISDMEHFLFYYLEPVDAWARDPSNDDLFHKYAATCFQKALTGIFAIIKDMTKVHEELCSGLKERLEMWGPTQFVSDILASFYDKMAIYEHFLNIYPSTVMTIDTLYKKSSVFSKFVDKCALKANNSNLKDLIFYLKNPIIRLSSYSMFISQLTSATEPAHPDFRALLKMEERFTQRESEWKSIVKDRLAHIRVLEAARSVQDNPALVTATRRLYISGLLTKIDMSNPQSLSDTRTYLLYNDVFIYCQKVKNNNSTKLIYKGSVVLKNAEIMPISEASIAKIAEVKKSSLPLFMRKSSNPQPSISTMSDIYGFEIEATELEAEVMAWGEGFYPVPPSGSTKRHVVMRTQTEAEQHAWVALLRKTSKLVNRKR